jgi:hypothetical protein
MGLVLSNRRLGRIPEARASYEEALTLVSKELDRRFLGRRLEEWKKSPSRLSILALRDDYRMKMQFARQCYLPEDH